MASPPLTIGRRRPLGFSEVGDPDRGTWLVPAFVIGSVLVHALAWVVLSNLPAAAMGSFLAEATVEFELMPLPEPEPLLAPVPEPEPEPAPIVRYAGDLELSDLAAADREGGRDFVLLRSLSVTGLSKSRGVRKCCSFREANRRFTLNSRRSWTTR